MTVWELRPKCKPYKLILKAPEVCPSAGTTLLIENREYENFNETEDEMLLKETWTETEDIPEAILDLTLESDVQLENAEAVAPNLEKRPVAS